jgi:hypothetical protein
MLAIADGDERFIVMIANSTSNLLNLMTDFSFENWISSG